MEPDTLIEDLIDFLKDYFKINDNLSIYLDEKK
jgi:hypothetical protein